MDCYTCEQFKEIHKSMLYKGICFYYNVALTEREINHKKETCEKGSEKAIKKKGCDCC